MYTQSQFKEFLQDIEPSATTKGYCKVAHEKLRELVAKHEVYKDYHVDSVLSGSYKRDTAIRPKTVDGQVRRPDVDIIVFTTHSLSDPPKTVIDLLYDSLKDDYEKVSRQTRSVNIETDKADIDVVPIIAPENSYGVHYIPDRKEEEWIVANPQGHTTWATQINSETNGLFKPLVKIIKWWRRENPTISKRPKGFIIECIVAECMNKNETQYGELVVSTMENIVNKYALNMVFENVPFIEEPGVPRKSVTDNISFDAFKGFYNKLKEHAEIGRKAISEEDAEESLKLWRQIFGDRFPKSGGLGKSTLSEGLTSANLFFPDKPIQPKRPAGFAK